MNVLCICGSPRSKGNSSALLHEVQKGIENHVDDAQVTYISAYKFNVSACLHCDSCKKGIPVCVQKDDTKEVMEKVEQADVLVFATPVYWWGISAKLKLIVDKFYSCVGSLKESKKKVLIVSVGEAETTDQQYTLIRDQFACICDYLGWDFLGSLDFSAYEAGKITENTAAMEEALNAWKKI